MKTAMQELIEWFYNRPEYDKTSEGYEIIEKAKELLEKEKDWIIHTYWVAYKEGRYSGDETAEEYYNETYK